MLALGRTSLLTYAAVLASFFTAWGLETVAHLHTDVVVLAVVLALMAGRAARRAGPWWQPAVVLPLAALWAGLVGQLMRTERPLGDAVFVLVVAAGIWMRRFGPSFTRLGTLLTLPLIALLTTPVPRVSGAHNGLVQVLWAVPIAAMSTFWVLLFQRLAPSPVGNEKVQAASSSGRTSTRMAVQMALTLGAAFVLGEWLFGDHWPWLVLTGYVVAAGNRGRGDVLVKGLHRLAGAMTGTIVATLLAGVFAPGDRTAVVAVLVTLGLALLARPYGYAYWAAGVTAALAFLYGYYGQGGTGVLAERVGAVAVATALAVAIAWWVLPIRTTDMIRRRIADVLADVHNLLTAARRSDPDGLQAAASAAHSTLARLEEASGTIRLHDRLSRATGGKIWPRPPLADAVRGVLALERPLEELTADLSVQLADGARIDREVGAELARVHGVLTSTRRTLGRRPDSDPPVPAPTEEREKPPPSGLRCLEEHLLWTRVSLLAVPVA